MPPFDDQSGRLALAIFIIILCWLLLKRWCSVHPPHPGTRYPPCLPALPILGTLPFLPSDNDELVQYFMKKAKQLGNVFGLYFGSRYVVVLNSAETIKEALLKKSYHFADRTPFFTERTYLNVNSKGIIHCAYNEAYRQRRQLYLAILKQFGLGYRSMETRINSELEELVTHFRLTDGRPFDPEPMLSMCLVNVIICLMFGERLPYGHPTMVSIKDRIRDWFLHLVYEVDFLPMLRFMPKSRQRINRLINTHQKLLNTINVELDKVLSELASDDKCTNDGFIRRFIEETTKQGNSTEPKKDIQKTIQSGDFDREELLYAVRDFFGGGFDTTTTTLRWFLLEMANHRDIQTRVQQEIDSVIGRERLPSLDDEVSLPYTQAVMLEIMRRNTLVPLGLFHATLCDTQVGDNFIPADSMVIVNLYSAHMDPNVWINPLEFRPERFLNDLGEVIRKSEIMSFSLGKRSCPGEILARQEIFLFMAGIAQNFDILPPEGQDKITCGQKTILVTEPIEHEVRLVARFPPLPSS